MAPQHPTDDDKTSNDKRAQPESGKPEHRPGKQNDDNVDDLGRNVNDPGKTLDQPTNESH